MDVELGAGLGDELVGFDGLDDLSAPNNSRGGTPDLFKFFALDDGGVGTVAQADETEVAASATAPPSPGSSGTSSTTWLADGGERDFAQEDWKRDMRENGSSNLGLGFVGAMLGTGVGASVGMASIDVRGKPRARKRPDVDDALESVEDINARPIPKRRSSANSIKLEILPVGSKSSNALEQQDVKPTTSRSHSFHVLASAGWGTPTSQAQPSVGVGAYADASNEASNSKQRPKQSTKKYTFPSPLPARGGAIKVKKDVLSVSTRPRISVFMSKPRPQRPMNTKLASALSLDRSSSIQNFGHRSLVSTAALPGSYGHPLAKDELPPTAGISRATSASRFKDLRIMVGGRARSQAEQHVVETTPPVVAMGLGSRRGSSPGLEQGFAPPPTLQRASSVGALTIAGKGDTFCQTLSPSSEMLPSYELSERVQGKSAPGGQRRNLVCKVFSSPVNRPSCPPCN